MQSLSNSFDYQRLRSLEDILGLLHEKLKVFQEENIVSDSVGTRFEAKQRIKREIVPEIQKYELEYASILERTTNFSILMEADAVDALSQIYQASQHLTAIQQNASYPNELKSLLLDIQQKLDEPGKTAAAKLKVVLPIIPLIASYELELDTEGLMFQVWQRLKMLFRG
jgi:antirestriction protein ArdC